MVHILMDMHIGSACGIGYQRGRCPNVYDGPQNSTRGDVPILGMGGSGGGWVGG